MKTIGKSKKITDLTDAEIRQIVSDIFNPVKISCIKKEKREDAISCKIYTEWETYDDDGKKIVEVIPDEIELRNPFDCGSGAIWASFQITRDDYVKLSQFCFAKGIYGASIQWLLDNPYMDQEQKEEINIIFKDDKNLKTAMDDKGNVSYPNGSELLSTETINENIDEMLKEEN